MKAEQYPVLLGRGLRSRSETNQSPYFSKHLFDLICVAILFN